MYLDPIKARESELRNVGQGKCIPCTNEEITELENWIGCALPPAYKEFL